MGRYSNDTRPPDDTDKSAGGPPDATSIIVETLLVPWTRKHGRLPQPCPMGLRDCANWWLNVMQEPEARGETYQCAAVGGGLRWECGYASSRRAGLLGFLGMTDRQRLALVNIVTRDKIPYRGESFSQFIDISEESEAMRSDPETYKRSAIARLNAAFSKTLHTSKW